MTGFVKLDAGILDSSLWAESADVCKVFITMLAMCEPDGLCRATAPGISRRAILPLEVVREALTRLEAPDEDSRTPTDEGRRVRRVPGGYLVVNYAAYRKRDYTAAERKRRQRERESLPPPTPPSTETDAYESQTVTSVTRDRGKRSRRRESVDTPEAREIIRLRHELLGGRDEATLPKLEAAGHFLGAGFTVADARRIFETIATGPKGGKGHAAFCRFENRTFEYALRPETAQKLLDEAEAIEAPSSRPFGNLTFAEQDRIEAARRARP